MKLSETHEALTVVYLQWPHIVVTEPMARLWHMSFGDLPADKFLKALVGACKLSASGFPPTIGQVESVLHKLDNPQKGTEGRGWACVLEACRRYSQYDGKAAMEAVRVVDPIAAKVMEQITWQSICEWKTDDQVANRAHFMKMYAAEAKRAEEAETLGLPQNERGTLPQGQPSTQIQRLIHNTLNAIGTPVVKVSPAGGSQGQIVGNKSS